MTADAAVVKKALADACGDVSDGGAGGELSLSGAAGAGDLTGSIAQTTPIEAGESANDPVGGAAFVARPASTQEAAAVMRVAAGHELAVLLRGGGSRLAWGTPPSRCDLVIDTSRLSGVVEHAAGDLVARVRAGTRMGEVAAVLAEAGQETRAGRAGRRHGRRRGRVRPGRPAAAALRDAA